APVWWSPSGATNLDAANDSAPYTTATVAPLSGGAYAFQMFFTMLTDPNANAPFSSALQLWDRGSPWPGRRESYSRPLILSGGPDKTPGVPVFAPAYYRALDDYNPGTVALTPGPAFSGASPVLVPTELDTNADPNILAIQFLRAESQAARATYVRAGLGPGKNPVSYTLLNGTATEVFDSAGDAITAAIREAGNDDLTNQNLNAPGGATQ